MLAQRSEAQPSPRPGLVAAAETDGLAAFTGRRDRPRPARQRGGPAATRGLSDAPLPVLIARDRTPATTAAVLASAHTPAVRAVLEPLLDPDGVRCADGSAVYVALAPQLHLAQQPVNRRGCEQFDFPAAWVTGFAPSVARRRRRRAWQGGQGPAAGWG